MKTFDQIIIKIAEEVLTDLFGCTVQVEVTGQLDSDQKVVLRCKVVGSLDGQLSHVVLKQLPVNETQIEDRWFLNEWAGLQFLTSLPCQLKFGPRMYGSHRDRNLMILEDLGDHQTLQNVLYGNNAQEAENALVDFGGYLGCMHATTCGRENEFSKIRKSLGLSTLPIDDASRDIRKDMSVLQECLNTLKITPSPEFYSSIEQTEAAMHESGPFRVYTHGDAGPHNILYRDSQLRMFDFEFGTFKHALTDAVCARMAFPSAYRGRHSPPSIIQRFEESYRSELEKGIPEAADQRLFREAIVQGCAHWALTKLIPWWEFDLKEGLKKGEPSPVGFQKGIAHLRAFVAVSDEFDSLSAIRVTLQNVIGSLLEYCPNIEQLPYFPAFEDRAKAGAEKTKT